MKFAQIAFAIVASIPTTVSAQQLTADPCAAQSRATFDVSTVKPSDKSGSFIRTRGDSMTSRGALRGLILFGFDLRDFQITGGPDWVNTQVWEISAKVDPPDPDPATLDDADRKALQLKRRQRAQSLLAERFQFKCHFTSRELPIYELAIAKNGAKLKRTAPSAEKRHSIYINGDDRKMDVVGTGITLDELIHYLLSDAVERTVVDKTGLTGTYDIALTFMPTTASTQDSGAESGPTIFTAVEEQLGLKLVPSKGPVPVLVIDSVERPSEN